MVEPDATWVGLRFLHEVRWPLCRSASAFSAQRIFPSFETLKALRGLHARFKRFIYLGSLHQ
jgi:hypothetical protein